MADRFSSRQANELTELPADFGSSCARLHTLLLSGNRLAALPESFTELDRLHTLSRARAHGCPFF